MFFSSCSQESSISSSVNCMLLFQLPMRTIAFPSSLLFLTKVVFLIWYMSFNILHGFWMQTRLKMPSFIESCLRKLFKNKNQSKLSVYFVLVFGRISVSVIETLKILQGCAWLGKRFICFFVLGVSLCTCGCACRGMGVMVGWQLQGMVLFIYHMCLGDQTWITSLVAGALSH